MPYDVGFNVTATKKADAYRVEALVRMQLSQKTDYTYIRVNASPHANAILQ